MKLRRASCTSILNFCSASAGLALMACRGIVEVGFREVDDRSASYDFSCRSKLGASMSSSTAIVKS
jgi:hypothetical protein